MDNFAEYMVKKRPDSRDNAKRAGIIALAVVLCVASVFLVFVTHSVYPADHLCDHLRSIFPDHGYFRGV